MVGGAQSDLNALAAAIESARAPLIDHAIFDTLMALAGPEVAPELLRQLDADLAEVAARLAPALDAGDHDGVRAPTHVLMALAGSVGATPLYTLAAQLNQTAHEGGSIAQDGKMVLTGLADLRHFINDAGTTKPTTKGPA